MGGQTVVVFLGGKNIVAAAADEKEGEVDLLAPQVLPILLAPSLLLPPLPSLRYD